MKADFLKRILFGAFATTLLFGGANAAETDEAARAALPAGIRDGGVLKVAIMMQWAPFSYYDAEKKPAGIDVEVVDLIASKLGLKPEWIDLNQIPVMIGGVDNGRFDISPSLGITAERSKIIDFVPYFRSTYALLVKKGMAGVDINNLCGHLLAVTQGSAQVSVVDSLSKDCLAAGKSEIKTEIYPNGNATQLAVANGRGEGVMVGSAVGKYIQTQNTNLEMAPGLLDNRYTMLAMLVSKKRPELKEALMLAMESAIADGSYEAILKRLDVPEATVTPEELRRPAEQYLSLNK
ncbi:transporter substrate-binding domain-containing protein [Rhizobium sp. CF142]|uniref:transporter substrate-binding domain-containing protein n=1 Tax=Rhizobium sp. CF142 TaxID=1144314 RepID=UPI00026EEAE8|nr:transporter substrate-binding domain-containing protein [Rhizobium sp. CF142]EJJ31488.1 periplasmic component of amino acid ABC-type transporter/signal transduction system [Rhizobium sp. CF142]